VVTFFTTFESIFDRKITTDLQFFRLQTKFAFSKFMFVNRIRRQSVFMSILSVFFQFHCILCVA